MKLLKPAPAKPGEINYSAFDRFTIVHFLIGSAYSYFNLPFLLVLFFAIGWEIIENPLKVKLHWLFPHGTADSFTNAASDTIAVILGWGVTEYFRH